MIAISNTLACVIIVALCCFLVRRAERNRSWVECATYIIIAFYFTIIAAINIA